MHLSRACVQAGAAAHQAEVRTSGHAHWLLACLGCLCQQHAGHHALRLPARATCCPQLLPIRHFTYLIPLATVPHMALSTCCVCRYAAAACDEEDEEDDFLSDGLQIVGMSATLPNVESVAT